VGDLVAINSPGNIIYSVFQVTAVAGGAVSGIRPVGPGLYSSTPSNIVPLTTTAVSGAGTGLTVWAGEIVAAGTTAGGIAIRDGSLPGWIRDCGVCDIYGVGAPTSNTGKSKARTDSKYTDTSAGDLYLNKGSIGAPAWHKVTTA